MAAKKKSALDEMVEDTAPVVSVTGSDPAAHAHTFDALPATKAIRTHVGGAWEPFIEGQGQLGVLAIQFDGGVEWHLGKGWVK